MKRIAIVTLVLASLSGVTYAANCGGGTEADTTTTTIQQPAPAPKGDTESLRHPGEDS